MAPKRIPSKNLSHSDHCKRVIGWIMGVKHPCTCGAEDREDARLAMVRDAMRYRWLRHRTAAQDAGGGRCGMVFPEIYGKRDWLKGSVAEHLDDAIDALIANPENC